MMSLHEDVRMLHKVIVQAITAARVGGALVPGTQGIRFQSGRMIFHTIHASIDPVISADVDCERVGATL
jgi:hypothetical protein